MLSKLQNIRRNAKKKGFTLVELVVVIIIIAIIAAVALPRIASFQESARKSRINSEHRQLVTAIQSRIAQADEPTTEYEKIKTIEDLKDYMNVKGGTLEKTLAKDGGKIAHEIKDGVLTSKYTDPNKTGTAGKSDTWTYNFSPASK
ncbi:prepilin-type N-terminal cleavage/methylation domain-containing protein [Streptococcus gallolyticus]|nr:prepilin-type N-terminal cleavage/methylation domain-containing protein [Streptococcus gallolyticus]MBY5040586.1 prepilin-type N-terminal cleavage/methylation domain-containing protein [Streptococcus gallolyticus]